MAKVEIRKACTKEKKECSIVLPLCDASNLLSHTLRSLPLAMATLLSLGDITFTFQVGERQPSHPVCIIVFVLNVINLYIHVNVIHVWLT